MTEPETLVRTRNGVVRGIENNGMLVWRGIPFAAPPVGEFRFRPPAPALEWSGIRDADALPAIAWQSPPPPGMPPPADGVAEPPPDENCLFVSVTRPAGPVPGGGLPVLVWIHGGGYLTGNALLDADGVAIARHGIVVVSVGYRLGGFGFLYLADLFGAGFGSSGCVGLLDQVQALRWVRDNIEAFGGDPGRTTLYGISAGAKSVANLLSLPVSRNLVQRAISGSGGGEHAATLEQATEVRRRLFAALGLTTPTPQRLTSIPASELVDAQEVLGTGGRATWLWRPVVDGNVLHDLPIRALERGAAAGIPLLVGNNGREGATFALFEPTAIAQAGRVLTELFGAPGAATIRAAYRADDPDIDESAIDVAVLGTERYGAPTTRLADAQSRYADVWRYRFDLNAPGLPPALAGGHGMDAPAVWSAHRWDRLDSPQARASSGLSAAVATFALGRPPAAPRSQPWPRYAEPGRSTLILDADPHVEGDPRPAERRAWQGRSWPSGTWWAIGDLNGRVGKATSR